MTIVDDHVAHHKHVQALYEDLLKDVEGITMHTNPGPEYDSNFGSALPLSTQISKSRVGIMPTSRL